MLALKWLLLSMNPWKSIKDPLRSTDSFFDNDRRDANWKACSLLSNFVSRSNQKHFLVLNKNNSSSSGSDAPSCRVVVFVQENKAADWSQPQQEEEERMEGERERERGGRRRRWRKKSWNEGERTDRRLKERADVRRGAIRAWKGGFLLKKNLFILKVFLFLATDVLFSANFSFLLRWEGKKKLWQHRSSCWHKETDWRIGTIQEKCFANVFSIYHVAIRSIRIWRGRRRRKEKWSARKGGEEGRIGETRKDLRLGRKEQRKGLTDWEKIERLRKWDAVDGAEEGGEGRRRRRRRRGGGWRRRRRGRWIREFVLVVVLKPMISPGCSPRL